MATITIEVEAASRSPRHAKLERWVEEAAQMCKPDRVHWCDGSTGEYQAILRLMVLTGTAIPLDAEKRPNSFLVRSDPADVARVEGQNFICSRTREDAGPTNNWEDPAKMKSRSRQDYLPARWLAAALACLWFPLQHGAGLDRRSQRLGVEITDSPYVVASMHIMSRVGSHVLRRSWIRRWGVCSGVALRRSTPFWPPISRTRPGPA